MALAAKVSVGTVSRVLNPNTANNIRVSQETRERIMKIAKELDYSPNYGATLLRGHSSKTIGIAVNLQDEFNNGMINDYAQRIVNGLSRATAAKGYNLLLITEEKYQQLMDIKRVDAMVIIGFKQVNNSCCSEMVETFRRFNEKHYPYIVINNICDEIEIPSIKIDNAYGMKLIAEHIINQEYDSVAFLGEQTANPQAHFCERFSALCKYLPNHKITVFYDDALDIDHEEFSQQYGANILHKIFERNELPRCIVCGNDHIAQGVLSEAYRLGIKIPSELAVIGFDDAKDSEFFAPSLTTIHQPLEEFGELALDFLLRKLVDPTLFEDKVLKPYLIERCSG